MEQLHLEPGLKGRLNDFLTSLGGQMIQFGLQEMVRPRQAQVPPETQPINGAPAPKLPFDPHTDCAWCYVAKVLASGQIYLKRANKHLTWQTGTANFFVNLARRELTTATDITRELDPRHQGEFSFLGDEISKVRLILLNPNAADAFIRAIAELDRLIDLAFAGAEGGAIRPPVQEAVPAAPVEWETFHGATPDGVSSQGQAAGIAVAARAKAASFGGLTDDDKQAIAAGWEDQSERTDSDPEPRSESSAEPGRAGVRDDQPGA